MNETIVIENFGHEQLLGTLNNNVFSISSSKSGKIYFQMNDVYYLKYTRKNIILFKEESMVLINHPSLNDLELGWCVKYGEEVYYNEIVYKRYY